MTHKIKYVIAVGIHIDIFCRKSTESDLHAKYIERDGKYQGIVHFEIVDVNSYNINNSIAM